MAENTRSKESHRIDTAISEMQRAIEQNRLETDHFIVSEFSKRDAKLDKLIESMASLHARFSNDDADNQRRQQGGSLLGPHPNQNSGENSRNSNPNSNNSHQNSTTFGFNYAPRLDFPKFDGSNPRQWMIRCEGYFKIYPNVSDSQKITLSAMYFEGRASSWYQTLTVDLEGVTWGSFLDLLASRFDDLKGTKIIADFNKLRMGGSYELYVEKFEELKSCMNLVYKQSYAEDYFVASFLSGLSEELQAMVGVLKPRSLQEAVEMARAQIVALEAITRNYGTSLNSSNVPRKFDNQAANSRSSALKQPVKLLSTSEMAARREKGLCYNCDELFKPGHKCQMKSTFMIIPDDYNQLNNGDELDDSNMEEVYCSFLSDNDNLYAIRIMGQHKDQELFILIDSGSTRSYIQEDIAKSVGCRTESVKPVRVRSASGQRMISNLQTKDFSWTIGDQKFSFPLRLLKFEKYDMILGGNWMRSCNPVELDFEKMVLSLYYQGSKVRLQGMMPDSEFYHKGTKVRPSENVQELYMLSEEPEANGPNRTNLCLSGLLTEYAEVFEELQGLPRVGGLEHPIAMHLESVPPQISVKFAAFFHEDTEALQRGSNVMTVSVKRERNLEEDDGMENRELEKSRSYLKTLWAY